MENEKISATKTAEERFYLLREYLTKFVDLTGKIENPKSRNEEFDDEIDEKICLGDFLKEIEKKTVIREPYYTENKFTYGELLNIRGYNSDYKVFLNKIFPKEFQGENPLFLLNYVNILLYFLWGWSDYDCFDFYFQEIHEIWLFNFRLFGCFFSIFKWEKSVKTFEEHTRKTLEQTKNEKLRKEYEKELQTNVENFKKKYSKKVEEFLPEDYRKRMERIEEIKKLLDVCREKHKKYEKLKQIPFVNIMIRFLSSDNVRAFNKLQKESEEIKKIALSYQEDAKKAHQADFEKTVEDFTKKERQAMENKLEMNKITVDIQEIDRLNPTWREWIEPATAICETCKSISLLIKKIFEEDFDMIPDKFLPLSSAPTEEQFCALTKYLPDYIRDGKASTIEEAVQLYFKKNNS